jgi:hypothetical protein
VTYGADRIQYDAPHMQHLATPHSSWKALLEAPPPGSHLLQVYDSDEFMAAAVGHYAACGLQRGEAVRLDGTQAHLEAVMRHLSGLGVDVAGARRNEQLVLGDAEAELDGWAAEGPLTAEVFGGLLDAVFGATHADPRWSGFRWWAEFAPTLQRRGDDQAARMIEAAAGDAVLRHKGIVLCSERCNCFDASGYDHLHTLCGEHTHVIPADDYVAHRLTVNRAIAEVVGDLRGSLLHSLSKWKGPGCDLPSSQALLFWVRDAMPEHFEAVLERLRASSPLPAASADR